MGDEAAGCGWRRAIDGTVVAGVVVTGSADVDVGATGLAGDAAGLSLHAALMRATTSTRTTEMRFMGSMVPGVEQPRECRQSSIGMTLESSIVRRSPTARPASGKASVPAATHHSITS